MTHKIIKLLLSDVEILLYLLKIIFKAHAPIYNCHIIADISGWGNFWERSFFKFS